MAFTDLLDEKISEIVGVMGRPVKQPPAPATARRVPMAPVFGFFDFTARARPVAVAHDATGHRSQPSAHTSPEVLPPAVPSRVLSARDQRALQELIDLGATLDSRFTVGHLRRAFRTLARRYHPDRHPDSSDATKAQLARTFARVRAAYEQLQSAALPA